MKIGGSGPLPGIEISRQRKTVLKTPAPPAVENGAADLLAISAAASSAISREDHLQQLKVEVDSDVYHRGALEIVRGLISGALAQRALPS
jgi:hypothetical protein